MYNYPHMAKHWTVEDIPDQRGKVVLITGANSGIGFETALALAGKGAQVVLAVRNLEKGQAAADRILNRFPPSNLEIMLLDLASLESIRQFAESFLQKHPALDLLINNAGVMAIPFRQTLDGYEQQFGVNHLGHFALTGRLLSAILAAPEARVVTVSSHIHILGGINFNDLNSSKSYGPWRAYLQSKMANLLFAFHLQRWLDARHAKAISVGCHPGYAATNLQETGPRLAGSRWTGALMRFGNKMFAQGAAMGALPVLYAATAADVRGGDYFGPQGLTHMSGYPGKTQASRRSREPGIAQRLWEASEKLTGVRYEVIKNREKV